MKRVSLEEALWAISLLPRILDFKEPFGPIDDSVRASLDAAITQPFVNFGGHYHYLFLYQRAALMFYLIIKDHSMENGNKRSAVVITMYFLYKNGKTFNFSPTALYDVACLVASSNPDELPPDSVVRQLGRAFRGSIIDIKSI